MRSAESFAAHVVYKRTVWSKTEAGREAQRRNNATRAERNRQSTIKESLTVKPGVFDSGAVQQTLTMWGG